MTLRAILILLFLTSTLSAADWPQWRGLTGQGLIDDPAPLPVKWDAKTGENVLWKSPLPKSDTPYSSPIVRGDRVFVTIATNKPREHHVLCFDRKSGKQLWDTPVEPGPWNLTDVRGGYAAPTPCADADRVYALFGSAVLAGLDHEGKVLWRTELPRHAFDVAVGCSPILFEGTVLVQADMVNKQSGLMAFDAKTGDLRYDVRRPEVGFAHSTPTLVNVAGKPLMLVAASDALQGVDPATGQVQWWCKAKGDTVSPVFADGVAYIDSGRGGPGFAVAVAPDHKGDVTKTALRWTIKQVPEAFGSPALVGPHLYRLQSPGVLKCFTLADGAELYSQRLEGATAAASPVVTRDGVLYFASSGRSHVVKAGERFEALSVNDLGDPNYASPAVSDGRLYLKGRNFLWCIGAKAP